MNTQGFVLVILTILFVSCQIVGHRWIKKVTNCYFFWLAIGILCFTWLMIFRFADQFSAYYAHGPFKNPGSYDESMIISRGLMLDICPMMGFLMPIAIMVDPTRKIAKVLAPTSLLAGAITIASLAGDAEASLTAQYIFIGAKAFDGSIPNPCYFIMHFVQITLAVGIMLNTPRYGWKGWAFAMGWILLQYTYVGICKAATGARWFVSGLDYNDWGPDGEYYRVAKIFNVSPKICPYIGIPFMWMVGCGEVALKDYVFDKGWFRYGNAYSGKMYMYYNYNKFVKQRLL